MNQVNDKKIWLIAFEFRPFPGGQATYADEMARAYCALGYQVQVIAPAYPELESKPTPFQLHRILTHQKFNHRTVFAILRQLKNIAPDDIVLACDIRAGLATTIARFLYRFKKIVMFHGGEIVRADYSAFAYYSNWLAALKANKLIGNSHFSADLVSKHLGRPCAAIPLGVAPYWLAPPERTVFDSPQLAQLPTNVPWLSTVARVARRKGHLGAIAALQHMQEAGVLPYLYIIAGKVVDPIYQAELEAQIATSGGRVVYVGQISQHDVRLLYARSTVFLLPATHEKGDVEGFGLVITESGGQGCPAISTKVGGIPDAIIDGKTGLLCAEHDMTAIAMAIRKILTLPEYRQQLGQAAQTYAQTLTWERNAQRTIDGV